MVTALISADRRTDRKRGEWTEGETYGMTKLIGAFLRLNANAPKKLIYRRKAGLDTDTFQTPYITAGSRQRKCSCWFRCASESEAIWDKSGKVGIMLH